MSYPSTIEDLQENIRAYFASYFNTYLAGINAAKADGITLDSVAEFKNSDGNPWDQMTDPVILLRLDSVDAEYLDSGHDQITMQITASILIRKGNADDMAKIQARYAEAFRQVLRDAWDNGVSTFDVAPEKIQSFFYKVKEGETEAKLIIIQFAVMIDTVR